MTPRSPRLLVPLFVTFVALGAACAAAEFAWPARFADWSVVLRTVGVAAWCAAIAVLIGASPRGRTPALWRLDHFLPRLRRAKPGRPLREPSWPWRAARRVVPASWLSDPVVARAGRIRLWLRRIGPSLQMAPLRRLVQGGCFVAFLVLLHYVCWPYSARPAPSPRRWTLDGALEIEQATGDLLATEAPPADLPREPKTQFWLYDESPGGAGSPAGDRLIGRVTLVGADDVAWKLVLVEPLGDDQFDRLLTGSRWTLADAPLDAWPSHYADDLARKERIAAETFLAIDPLVGLSTAIAARSWVWSLVSAAAILLASTFVPRGFCGYLCPLGTLIDLFDAIVGRRVTRWRAPSDGWWVHVKYYLLAGTLVCAAGGVLVSGFVAAIPVVTRGFLFAFDPLQTAMQRGGHLIPPFNVGHVVSLALLGVVLGLGFLQPRFWCKYVCPSGAVFSICNVARITERHVESSCIHCNKCVEVCPFDAIKPDFTTRTSDCTLCQTCGGACPTEAIKFVERWNLVELKAPNEPPTGETSWGRRGFLSWATGGAAALAGGVVGTATVRAWGARLDDPDAWRPVRPPGSVPEAQFLQQCIRCGECFKACPNNVLHPLAFQQGLEGLWTPHVAADWAGCESSCNACGQVCPTGAIRALPLEEKKVARIGLAIVDTATCLPHAGREACQLCVDDCHAAGYHAIEFLRVHTQSGDDGQPLEGTGFVAPVVLADKCVGCGLCQTRCYGINVVDKRLLARSAIVVVAGEGREDRLSTGSYVDLRRSEAAERSSSAPRTKGESYLPDFLRDEKP